MSINEAASPLISPRSDYGADPWWRCVTSCWQPKKKDWIYSRNGLTPAAKLAKQLLYAIHDPLGKKKVQNLPFEVAISSDQLAQIDCAPLTAGVAQHQGSRDAQEDRYMSEEVSFQCENQEWNGMLYGVFDGCRDFGQVGEYLKEQMGPLLSKTMNRLLKKKPKVSDEVITNALTETFCLLSQGCRKAEIFNGATAICAFVVGKKIYFPIAGGSRAILVKPHRTYQLTEVAKVSKERFQKWHVMFGNELESDIDGTLRVGPQGEVTFMGRNYAREIGPKWMCPRPKITRIYWDDQKDDLENGWLFCGQGDFLILATDGLFEAATVDDVGDAVRKLAEAGIPPAQMAELLANRAGSCKGNDNVTVMVIAL